MAPSLAAALRASTLNDHQEILDTANAALKSSKKDALALHTRIVALLKLDRFDDVLRTVSDLGPDLKTRFAFEVAYALYKLGKLDDAAQVLATAASRTDAVKHLEGQVAYRAERFEAAWDTYTSFGEDSGEDGDLRINRIAVLAQLGWRGKPSGSFATAPGNVDVFEVAYNLACLQISKGNLLSALNLLQLSQRLCDELDDLSDDEKQSELVPIFVQQIYVYSRLGLTERARELQSSLALSDDCGQDTKSLADVNSAVLSSTDLSNRFLAQRTIEGPISRAKGTKLFNYQLEALRQLQLVLDLSIHKYKGTEKIAQAKSNPSPDTSAAVQAFAPIGIAASSWTCPEKPLAAATDLLSKRPLDVGLALTVIQLTMQAGSTDGAISRLETLLKNLDASDDANHHQLRHSPGLIATAVALYKLAGRAHMARSELGKAAAFWQHHAAKAPRSLLVEAGLELLKSDKPEDFQLASDTFSSLLASDASDAIAAAGVVAAAAATDRQKAESLATAIPAATALTRNINVDDLLAAGVALNTQASAGTKRSASTAAAATATATATAAKKRRHRKLPATYEEGKLPDPERWLPMRDRTSSRPKGGKKGKKKAEALTQGGYVKGEETLELAGGVGAVKVEKAPQVVSTGVAAGAKKKKKGRK
ncbi:hypothetical protein BROUX41_003660 [Berkeleyomyces rouxiae]|uniref:uncharacterized protein n=1 Tax=Berkeleyomyces rouxiae TaxID=2035830 RepID=UPI003B79D276